MFSTMLRCGMIFANNNHARSHKPPPNRSLNLTAPRAEFSVRSEYGKGSMLIVKQVLGDYTKNVNATAVQNGRRRLAPNR